MAAVNLARRRRVLQGLAGSALLPGVPGMQAIAQMPAQRPPLLDIVPLMKEIVKGAAVTEGRVKLDIPRLAENGHLVPLHLTIDSPMSAADYVSTVWLLSEKNPRPLIAKLGFTPAMGRAELVTRIRLASEQWVVALAQMSDGSFWADTTEVVVTETACLDAS